MTDQPNPGSDEAIAKGCTCPVLDNGHGKGYFQVIRADCPLHAPLWDAFAKARGSLFGPVEGE